MTFVRTHYIIDLVAGVIMAHYCHMAAEWIIYFFDVKVVGTPSDRRFNYCYKPCDCCGWSNKNASFYVDQEEEEVIRKINSQLTGKYGKGMETEADRKLMGKFQTFEDEEYFGGVDQTEHDGI